MPDRNNPCFHVHIVKWERQIIKHIMFITHVKRNAWLRSTRSKRTKVKSGPEERRPQVALIQTDVQCSTLLPLPIRCTLLKNTSEIGLWSWFFSSRYGNIASMVSTESQARGNSTKKSTLYPVWLHTRLDVTIIC